MRRPKWISLSLVVVSGLLASAGLFAHSGGLDSKGGHYNRKTGEYHYHRTPSPGSQGSSTKLGATASSQFKANPSQSSLGAYTDYQKVDALIALLEAKGITTRDELIEQIQADLK